MARKSSSSSSSGGSSGGSSKSSSAPKKPSTGTKNTLSSMAGSSLSSSGGSSGGSSGASKSVARSLTSSSGSSSSGGGSSGVTAKRMAGPRGLTESLSSSSSRTAAAASRPARDAYAQADTRGRRVSPTGAALFDRAEQAQIDRSDALRAARVAAAYAQADARGRRVSPTTTLSPRLASAYDPFAEQTPGAFGNNPMAQDMGIASAEDPRWVRSVRALADMAYSGFMAPGRALDGYYDQVIIDPETGGVSSMLDPRMIDDAAALAGFAQTGGIPLAGPRLATAGINNAFPSGSRGIADAVIPTPLGPGVIADVVRPGVVGGISETLPSVAQSARTLPLDETIDALYASRPGISDAVPPVPAAQAAPGRDVSLNLGDRYIPRVPANTAIEDAAATAGEYAAGPLRRFAADAENIPRGLPDEAVDPRAALLDDMIRTNDELVLSNAVRENNELSAINAARAAQPVDVIDDFYGDLFLSNAVRKNNELNATNAARAAQPVDVIDDFYDDLALANAIREDIALLSAGVATSGTGIGLVGLSMLSNDPFAPDVDVALTPSSGRPINPAGQASQDRQSADRIAMADNDSAAGSPPGLQESYDALAARKNNLVYDPVTGTYIPANPSNPTQLTPDPLPLVGDLKAEPVEDGGQTDFVRNQIDALADVARRKEAEEAPTGIINLDRVTKSSEGAQNRAISRGGKVEYNGMIYYPDRRPPTPALVDGIADAQVNDVPTDYDQTVDFIGDMAVGTPLGKLVNWVAPDAILGISELFKGLDDGVTYGGTGVRTNFQDSASGGSLIEQPSQYAYAPLPFPDVNGNGIDDRLEGIGFMGSQPTNFGVRQVRFPTTPPYDPGRSGEFSYFTGQGYAEGGMVDPMQDPRMELIADAEDVLEDIAEGEPADAEDAEILRAFVAQFGDDALRALNDQVMAGMKMRPSRSRETGSPRLIEGPGTETSDSIPAMIEDAPGGPQPAALSDGEVVIPANAVRAAGQGDREKGAAQLMALSDMLVNGQ